MGDEAVCSESDSRPLCRQCGRGVRQRGYILDGGRALIKVVGCGKEEGGRDDEEEGVRVDVGG